MKVVSRFCIYLFIAKFSAFQQYDFCTFVLFNHTITLMRDFVAAAFGQGCRVSHFHVCQISA